jgi:regulation of enolase protein 1 (concanavalin A-like superfamily)
VLVVLPSASFTQGALPAGWTNQDIGQPPFPGQSFYGNGIFELQGSGDGIHQGDTADQFQYAFTGLRGDGTVIARFLTAQDPNSDAGIMIRNTADPSSPYVMLSVGAGSVDLLSRSTYSSPADEWSTNPEVTQTPAWLKLVREGDTFSAYISQDGSNWLPLTDSYGDPITVVVPMNANIYAGVISSAAYDGAQTVASFDNVSVTGAGSGFFLSPSAGTLQAQPGGSATARVAVTGTPGFTDAVNLSSGQLPAGITASFHPTSVSGSGTTTLTLSVDSSVSPGTYPVAVSGTDTASASTQTVNLVLVVLPAAVQTPQPLPAGWTSLDIGQPAIAGQTSWSNGVFDLQGSGAGVANSAVSDQFQYAFTGLEGDGSITARLLLTQNVNSQVGIMIRDSIDPSAGFAMLSLSEGTLNYVYRSSYGVNASVSGSQALPAYLPVWLRLVRQGTDFQAWFSLDNVNWTELADTTVSMGTSVSAGLVDTATLKHR